MELADQRVIRGLLLSLLKQVEGDSGGAMSDRVDPPQGRTPVVMVVLGQADLVAGLSPPALAPAHPYSPGAVEQQGANSTAMRHPGLDRFDVAESNSSDTAPRSCFLEPDRFCCNSGACKMRGY